MSSVFSKVSSAPPIEVFQLTRDYAADTDPNKVSLSVGAYRTEEGKPWILPPVKKAEKLLAEQVETEQINHEYLPVLGLESFASSATRMLLGDSSPALAEGRAFGVQTLSGTGALRVGGEFLHRILGFSTVYYSDPTWANHAKLFANSGFTNLAKYRYWDPLTKSINISGLMEDLGAAPENSVVILHACAHNPTGMDLSQDQWKDICSIVKQKKLFTFFDCAYQGFASGDLSTDAWAVRYFESQGVEFFCSQSFSKNFGLYNERAGNLTVVMNNKEHVDNFKAQITLIIRAMYSNPPSHGARIVDTVFKSPELYKEWEDCIKVMAERIIGVRAGLRSRLEALGTPGDWSHITTQIGMFSYTGLSPVQCEFLKNEKHLYLLKSGRMSLCGVTPANIDHVAQSVHDAVIKFQ